MHKTYIQEKIGLFYSIFKLIYLIIYLCMFSFYQPIQIKKGQTLQIYKFDSHIGYYFYGSGLVSNIIHTMIHTCVDYFTYTQKKYIHNKQFTCAR